MFILANIDYLSVSAPPVNHYPYPGALVQHNERPLLFPVGDILLELVSTRRDHLNARFHPCQSLWFWSLVSSLTKLPRFQPKNRNKTQTYTGEGQSLRGTVAALVKWSISFAESIRTINPFNVRGDIVWVESIQMALINTEPMLRFEMASIKLLIAILTATHLDPPVCWRMWLALQLLHMLA